MMIKKKRPDKLAKKKPKHKEKHVSQPSGEEIGFTSLGILPDRDLKKNLGCG